MQDSVSLRNEVLALRQLGICGTIKVQMSSEPWNPVRAVILDNTSLPQNAAASRIRMHIPIPNLYAFARSASVIMLDDELQVVEANGVTRPLPGCERITDSLLAPQSDNFVAVREDELAYRGKFYFFITLDWQTDGFVHVGLPKLVQQFLRFVEAPAEMLQRDMNRCEGMWGKTKNPWWERRVTALRHQISRFED